MNHRHFRRHFFKKAEDLFSIEVLKSEVLRVKILIFVFTLLFLVWIFNYFFLYELLNPIFNYKFPIIEFVSVFGISILYESMLLNRLNFCIKHNILFPKKWQYGNAFVETSIPTILLYFLSNIISPIATINSPIVFFYFLFLTLSTLRLKFKISLFTGIIAGIEFLSLSLYINSKSTYDSSLPIFFQSNTAIYVKSLIFINTGLVTGFVANELKKRLINSISYFEDKNRILGMFGQYVSPSVVGKLLEQKTELVAENKYVCIMFLDIRNFTSFSEAKSPEEVILFLNTLFNHFIDIINKNNGIINKFLGDGFLAVFGAPLSYEGRDIENAVKASLEIIQKLEELNTLGVIHPTKIGIGLHAGLAMTGNVGSDERKEYTIIGDTVNLASRVEQMNKEMGTSLLITDSVYQKIGLQDKWVQLPPVKVKGRNQDVSLYKYVS